MVRPDFGECRGLCIEMGATEIYLLSVVATSLPYQGHFRSFSQYMTRVSDVLWRTLANVGYVTTRIDDDGTYRGVPVTVLKPTEQHSGFSLRTVSSWILWQSRWASIHSSAREPSAKVRVLSTK